MTRRPLPETRHGQIHKVVISDSLSGEHDLYVRANFHADGSLGEVFLNIGKPGSTLQGMLDGWAIMVSKALQYGMPLEEIVSKFSGQSFSPSGKTDDEEVPECTSLLDYVVRHLGGIMNRSTR